MRWWAGLPFFLRTRTTGCNFHFMLNFILTPSSETQGQIVGWGERKRRRRGWGEKEKGRKELFSPLLLFSPPPPPPPSFPLADVSRPPHDLPLGLQGCTDAKLTEEFKKVFYVMHMSLHSLVSSNNFIRLLPTWPQTLLGTWLPWKSGRDYELEIIHAGINRGRLLTNLKSQVTTKC